jgi:hypothetical protein
MSSFNANEYPYYYLGVLEPGTLETAFRHIRSTSAGPTHRVEDFHIERLSRALRYVMSRGVDVPDDFEHETDEIPVTQI